MRPFAIYCGYDPSTPDLHLGHTITMRKLRQFQDLGHDVTFLIGTFTGIIGDPSDKDSVRKQQTLDEAIAKAETYAAQAWRVLDKDRTNVRYNHEWLSKLDFADVIHLASNFTVQQFLTRENFSKRFESATPSGCTSSSTRSCRATTPSHRDRCADRRYGPAVQPHGRSQAHGERGPATADRAHLAHSGRHRRRTCA